MGLCNVSKETLSYRKIFTLLYRVWAANAQRKLGRNQDIPIIEGENHVSLDGGVRSQYIHSMSQILIWINR